MCDNMKRILKGCFLSLILLTCGVQTAEAADVKVTLNGSPLSFDAAPIIENGRVLAPMRGILEALGYSVNWQADTQTVLATKDDIAISMPLNSKTVAVNDKTVVIDTPAQLKGSRTFVPLRFLAEYSGAAVRWDQPSSTVVIHSASLANYNMKDSVVYLQTNRAQGSGVVLSSDGLIVTNYHVVEGASTVQVIFNDGTLYQGKTTVVGLDPQNDIALFRIEKSGLTPAIPSQTYSIGDTVTAIGSPHGQRNVITTGTVAGFDRDAISTTAVITNGNSGGGLFNASKELIGITASFGNGQYLSIPMNLVDQVPRNLSIPFAGLKQYDYQPAAPQNLRFTKNGSYAYVSWSPVYGAEQYYVYTANSENGTYTKLKNTALGGDFWYWGFPQSFGISINPKRPYYLKVSAVVNGVETECSQPLKIHR